MNKVLDENEKFSASQEIEMFDESDTDKKMFDGKIGKLRWFHWMAIAFSLVLTFIAAYFTEHQIEASAREHFLLEADRVVSLIIERMYKYEDALWGAVANIESRDDHVDHDEWKRFTDVLHLHTKYPGINGIGLIDNVSTEALEAYISDQRQGRPDFRVHPQHNKEDHWPVTYIEPHDSNKAAIGLDLAYETKRYEAAKKVRDLGTAQITAPITLVQDDKHTQGFLLFVPVYRDVLHESEEVRREQFRGMIYAPFIMNKLMRGTLEKENRHILIKISDANDVLYDEIEHADNKHAKHPDFTKIIDTEMYGRVWSFTIVSSESFVSLGARVQPIIVLLIGIIINIMLFFMLLTLVRSNKKAMIFAKKIIKAYKVKACHFTAIQDFNSSLIDNAADGIIVINTKAIVQQYNVSCEKMFRYSKEEVFGKNIKMLMPEPYHDEHDAYLARYEKTKEKHIIGIGREVSGKRKDGSVFPIELSVSEISIDNRRCYFGILRDITERKHMELMKDEFISTVSHELRTPLTSIKGSLGLLKYKKQDMSDEKIKKLLDICYENCDRLVNLVNDILSVEKIASGKMNYTLENVDIIPLIESIIKRNEVYSEKYGVGFSLESKEKTISCYVDKNRFDQVMTNLISNAAKFSHKDDSVTILVELLADKKCKISIIDHGYGIPESFHKSIFSKFSQAESAITRSRGGSGLGLNISKSIVEAFDGEIDFHSKEGEGTTFFFTLPIMNNKDNRGEDVG